MRANVIGTPKRVLCIVTLCAVAGCAGSSLVKLGNFNSPANVNVNTGNQNGAANANDNRNANENANGNQNANAGNGNGNANDNMNAVGNANGGSVVPPELTGMWILVPDCGAGFTMNVMADGSIAFEPIDPIISIDGSVTFGGNFNITVVGPAPDPPLPGEPAGQCTSGFSGVLSETGTVNGSTAIQCTGDPVGTPCSFVLQQF